MTAPVAIGPDDFAAALETQLKAMIRPVIAALGYGLEDPKSYDQVPEIESLSAAAFPAVAIGGARMTGKPYRSGGRQSYDGIWRISIGVWDRGKSYTDTQSKIQKWAKVIRTAILLGGSLGGIAKTVTWADESYVTFPQKEVARTFAGAEVEFDIAAENVIDLAAIASLIESTSTVTAVDLHLTVQSL